MNYLLTGGTLIIGSLFWQDHLIAEGDNIRKNWRESNLNMNSVTDVSVAIKYGRFSGSKLKKTQTYTMVFDTNLSEENYGTAKAVPFLQGVETIIDLLDKAKSMSSVEGNGDNFLIKGAKAWCVCGISFNPKINANLKDTILEKWSLAMQENKPGYTEFVKSPNNYGLSHLGEFLFDYPKEATELDFLIATATRPKNRDGIMDLSIKEIANFVSNRNYFSKNIENGISTFQDKGIMDYLKQQIN